MDGKEFDNFVLPVQGGLNGHEETKSRKLQIESQTLYTL